MFQVSSSLVFAAILGVSAKNIFKAYCYIGMEFLQHKIEISL